MAQTTADKISLRPLMPLYLVIFIGFIGYGMIVTLFVGLLMRPGHGFLPDSATTSHRTMVLGVLLALYPLGQFFGTPVLSSLSDRFGRKPVLLTSLGVTTACYGVLAIAIQIQSLPLLAVSLLVCGLGEANMAIAQSAIADVSAPEDRGRLFGYAYIAIRLGYVVGPLIGGQIASRSHDYAAPFWLVVGLLAGTHVWTQVRFKETYPPKAGRTVRYRDAFTSLLTVFTDRPIRMLYLVSFLLYVAVFGFSRAVLMYLVDEWHMRTSQITFFYAYFAVTVLFANLVLMPLLSPHFSSKKMAAMAAGLGGLATIAVAISGAEFWLWLTIGVSACCLSLCLSACAALLSNSVGPDQEGSVMGNNEALQDAGEAAGAAGAGFLAAILAQLPLVTYGALVILGALLLTRFRVPRAG